MTTLPLDGGFTPDEMISVDRYAVGLQEACSALQDAMLEDGLATRDVVTMFAVGLRAAVEGLALLLHTNIEQENTFQFADLEQFPRTTWVSYSGNKLNRALATFTDPTRPGPYLWGSPLTWLTQAVASWRRVDWTLGYATPFPGDQVSAIFGGPTVDPTPPRVTAIYPTVVGPHGDQRLAQWNLHRSCHYFFDLLDDCAGVVGTTAPPPARVVFQKGAALVSIYVETMVLLAGLRMRAIPGFAANPLLPPRFLDVHKSMEWGLSARNHESIPARLFEINSDGLTAWLPQLRTAQDGTTPDFGSLVHAIKRLGDAWRHSDDAAWNQFELHIDG